MPIMLKHRMKKLYDFYKLPGIFIDSWNEMEWARMQVESIYDNQFDFPHRIVENFLNVNSHKERILQYAKH